MAISLVTTPTYALPSAAVSLKASVNTSSNFVRLWCVDAPKGSILRKQLDDSDASRVEIVPPNSQYPAGITPGLEFKAQLDKGGRYTFVGQEYTLVASSYGGGYSNSPDAYKSETKVGAEQTLYVYLGQRITQRLGASAYGDATLLAYAWNDTIRETGHAVHGVQSPAIINATSSRALSAASAPNVLTQLASLKDAAVSTLTPNLATLIAELVLKIPRHFNNTGAIFHANITGAPTPDADNDTEIEDLSDRCGTPVALARAAQVLYSRLRQHQQNGPAGASRYHRDADFTNSLIADGVGSESDPSLSLAAVADVVRAYEAHRVDSTSHALADSLNTITTPLGPLLSLHKEFLAAMTTLTPTAYGGTQAAAVRLSALGFRLE